MSPIFNLFAACDQLFFGLVPWYHFLALNGGCGIANFKILPGPNGNPPSSIPLIFLALADDLLRIAGLAAVGYIIYAGIMYISSQGNPEQTARAQNTIINALVGLVIASISVALVTFLGNTLGG